MVCCGLCHLRVLWHAHISLFTSTLLGLEFQLRVLSASLHQYVKLLACSRSPPHADLQAQDYRIQYDSIVRLFVLPKSNVPQTLVVISLDPPIRKGQTYYPHILCQFNNDDELNIELDITEEQLEAKNEKVVPASTSTNLRLFVQQDSWLSACIEYAHQACVSCVESQLSHDSHYSTTSTAILPTANACFTCSNQLSQGNCLQCNLAS